jgi:glucose/arabinose dehydrogenase
MERRISFFREREGLIGEEAMGKNAGMAVKRTPGSASPQNRISFSPRRFRGMSSWAGIFLLGSVLLFSGGTARPFLPTVGKAPQDVADQFFPDGKDVKVEAWVEELEIPWSLIFLPDGRALVSERPGRIRAIKEGRLLEAPYAALEVAHVGEGGLLGLTRHPDFPIYPYIYAMHTYRKGNDLYNRVIRLKDTGGQGIFDRVIIDSIPGGRFHDGGRIAFGPDGMLYITTGETFTARLAQDLNSLAGKILRVTPGGEIPRDNPFPGSPVFSYGHRNPQGLAWHPETKELFSSEHGPSGEFLLFANDEINVIVKGGNYGWAEVVGAPGQKPYRDPFVVWKKTTPPSGMTFYTGNLLPQFKNDLFVATLKSQALIRIAVKKETGPYRVLAIERWFAHDDSRGKFGRLRDTVEGPEGALYFLTNNRDGRGNPRPGDDRIYRIVPR